MTTKKCTKKAWSRAKLLFCLSKWSIGFFLPFLLPSPLLLLKLPIVVIQKLCYHGNKTSHFSLLLPTLNFPLYSTFSAEASSLSLQSNMSLMPFIAMVTGCWIWQCGRWKQSRKPYIFYPQPASSWLDHKWQSAICLLPVLLVLQYGGT